MPPRLLLVQGADCDPVSVCSRLHLAVPALLLTALLAVISGCGGADDTTAPATAGGSTTADAGGGTSTSAPSTGGSSDGSTEDDASTDAPPFSADVSGDTAEPSSDARVTVRDIRIGRHDGFDRVVFEVGGTGTPGWDVRYVGEAVSQGSGDPVAVGGAAVLRIGITGVEGVPHTGEEEYSGPDPLAAAGTEVVTEVAFDATFEGTTVAFVGMTAQAPFRVYLLEDPARVVLEVRDPVRPG
jgi:hypothetical protein